MNWWLLGSVGILSVFGLLMVINSSQFSSAQTFGDRYFLIRSQFLWFGLGLACLLFSSSIDYHWLKKLSLPLFLFSVLLLLAVFLPGLGVSAGGAHRWLKLAGLTIQPAEIIKLSTVILLATVFEQNLKTKLFIPVIGVIVFVLGFLQKDLGSAIIFALINLGVYFAAGGKIRYLLSSMILGIFGFILFIITSSYRKQRILAFLDPFSDPQGYSYHISQVLIALGSGGLFGLGIGQSRQKFAYIPEVATDSIFSVIGEEFGLIGGLLLLVLLGMVIHQGIKIAENAPDKFGQILSIGLVLWVGAQAVVNLAAMVAVIPLTGVPLPFISYGGSALLANLTAVGLLLSVNRRSNL